MLKENYTDVLIERAFKNAFRQLPNITQLQASSHENYFNQHLMLEYNKLQDDNSFMIREHTVEGKRADLAVFDLISGKIKGVVEAKIAYMTKDVQLRQFDYLLGDCMRWKFHNIPVYWAMYLFDLYDGFNTNFEESQERKIFRHSRLCTDHKAKFEIIENSLYKPASKNILTTTFTQDYKGFVGYKGFMYATLGDFKTYPKRTISYEKVKYKYRLNKLLKG
jgi:hypothetical protein